MQSTTERCVSKSHSQKHQEKTSLSPLTCGLTFWWCRWPAENYPIRSWLDQVSWYVNAFQVFLCVLRNESLQSSFPSLSLSFLFKERWRSLQEIVPTNSIHLTLAEVGWRMRVGWEREREKKKWDEGRRRNDYDLHQIRWNLAFFQFSWRKIPLIILLSLCEESSFFPYSSFLSFLSLSLFSSPPSPPPYVIF